jgi:hypothetical protein
VAAVEIAVAAGDALEAAARNAVQCGTEVYLILGALVRLIENSWQSRAIGSPFVALSTNSIFRLIALRSSQGMSNCQRCLGANV